MPFSLYTFHCLLCTPKKKANTFFVSRWTSCCSPMLAVGHFTVPPRITRSTSSGTAEEHAMLVYARYDGSALCGQGNAHPSRYPNQCHIRRMFWFLSRVCYYHRSEHSFSLCAEGSYGQTCNVVEFRVVEINLAI